jgi:hypothetical protein
MASRLWQASCSRGDKAVDLTLSTCPYKTPDQPWIFQASRDFLQYFQANACTAGLSEIRYQQLPSKSLPTLAILPCVACGRNAFTVCEKPRSGYLPSQTDLHMNMTRSVEMRRKHDP